MTRTYATVILDDNGQWPVLAVNHRVRTGVEAPRVARIARVKNLVSEKNCMLVVGDTSVTGPQR